MVEEYKRYMNGSLISLTQKRLSFLVLTLVTGVSPLAANAQVKLSSPPSVKLVQAADKVDEEGLKKKAAEVIKLLSEENYGRVRTMLNRELEVMN